MARIQISVRPSISAFRIPMIAPLSGGDGLYMGAID